MLLFEEISWLVLMVIMHKCLGPRKSLNIKVMDEGLTLIFKGSVYR